MNTRRRRFADPDDEPLDGLDRSALPRLALDPAIADVAAKIAAEKKRRGVAWLTNDELDAILPPVECLRTRQRRASTTPQTQRGRGPYHKRKKERHRERPDPQ